MMTLLPLGLGIMSCRALSSRLHILTQPWEVGVELYLKAGLDVPCFRGCPVNWYKTHCIK
jgi:hypothetical protein